SVNMCCAMRSGARGSGCAEAVACQQRQRRRGAQNREIVSRFLPGDTVIRAPEQQPEQCS
ncbi:MAG: hypothetical protein Q8P60_01820, partial [Pseudorhodobacter sp.]|nr:hypothetical protein [Pseudorhodobacter sp.]